MQKILAKVTQPDLMKIEDQSEGISNIDFEMEQDQTL